MSTEEDLELRDLVTQTLESNGVLSKIRAELRASVFLALEEQDLLQSENSYANKNFKNYLKTSEGILLTGLVREFLEFFELDFTLSVFDPETSCGKDYEYFGRNTLVKELGMKNVNGEKGPLLAQILRTACKEDESDKEDSDGRSGMVQMEDEKIIQKKNVKNSQPVVDLQEVNKISFDRSCSLDKTESLGETHLSQITANKDGAVSMATQSEENKENTAKTSAEENNEKKKTENERISAALTEEKPLAIDKNDLTSLSNLPPLMSSSKLKPEILGPTSNGKKDINQIRTLINSLEVADNNYDEDFQSSASGSGMEGRSGKNSLPGSETDDIEEDIASGIDDLLSNASGMEDLTVDATASNASGLGDYMENL